MIFEQNSKPSFSVLINISKGRYMKKHIASQKWLITYFVVLLFLACFTAIGIALIMYSVSANSTETLAVGIVVLVYMLPITGIVLFYLNRRACRIWVEDGCFKWKGLFSGFSGSITPEEKHLWYDLFHHRRKGKRLTYQEDFPPIHQQQKERIQ